MRQRNMARFFALLVCALVALQWVITAQAQTAGKRPLTYDAVDYWRAIQGTRLSNDGQWLAYAVTSQAEDGELFVRNLKTGQEFRHSRGTSPVFTQDGAFVVFTVAQSKADEEKDKQATRGSETQAAGVSPLFQRYRRYGDTGLSYSAWSLRNASCWPASSNVRLL